MTVGFSTKIYNKPTYFVQKIWQGLWGEEKYENAFDRYFDELEKRELLPQDVPFVLRPKIHTIRNFKWLKASEVKTSGWYYVKRKEDEFEKLIYVTLANNHLFYGQNREFNPYVKGGEIRLRHRRFEKGVNLHLVINNRSPNRFQFAPTLKCTRVQTIEIKWDASEMIEVDGHDKPTYLFIEKGQFGRNLYSDLMIFIDRKRIPVSEWGKLAHNDGFETLEGFLTYFNQDFEGQIIHWTDKKY